MALSTVEVSARFFEEQNISSFPSFPVREFFSEEVVILFGKVIHFLANFSASAEGAWSKRFFVFSDDSFMKPENKSSFFLPMIGWATLGIALGGTLGLVCGSFAKSDLVRTTVLGGFEGSAVGFFLGILSAVADHHQPIS